MAMPRRFPVEFGTAFPRGLYAISEVEPARDWDESSGEKFVQARDVDKRSGEGTGMPVWTVEVMDADPEASRSQKSLTLRIVAESEPRLPAPLDGSPFVPIELDGLTAAPYVATGASGRGRLAWSYRATGIKPTRAAAKSTAAKDAA
jgi:hypothetical protein